MKYLTVYYFICSTCHQVCDIENVTQCTDKVVMKCAKCLKDIDDNEEVYSISGLRRWYCKKCSIEIRDILELNISRVPISERF